MNKRTAFRELATELGTYRPQLGGLWQQLRESSNRVIGYCRRERTAFHSWVVRWNDVQVLPMVTLIRSCCAVCGGKDRDQLTRFLHQRRGGQAKPSGARRR